MEIPNTETRHKKHEGWEQETKARKPKDQT